MKKFIALSIFSLLLCCNLVAQISHRTCGIEAEKAAIIKQNPNFAAQLEQQRRSLQGIADAYKAAYANGVERDMSTVCAVPVIFHILVDSAQFVEIGGMAGIQQRCDSQILVLNRDYNRRNSDSVHIPSCWKPLYGNVGIHFGLASVDPIGLSTPGFEVLITNKAFVGGPYTDYNTAKYTDSGGLSAWDNTKYMNVWCLNFSDNTGLLGVTTPLSYTGGGIPNSEMGICIAYNALGKRASHSDHYPAGDDQYDEGRTLTHETGHFFEIWHVWGDDGGCCPWNCGVDDGIADTPPQAEFTSGNPVYTIPCGTFNDACLYDTTTNEQPIGVACLDYMDYTDDTGMHLFTPDQAAVMASMILPTGQSYSLTQNCGLYRNTGVTKTENDKMLNVSPNPTNGIIRITYNNLNAQLTSINVINVVGEQVLIFENTEANSGFYSLDLSKFNKGVYFVRCNFANSTETVKILLQ